MVSSAEQMRLWRGPAILSYGYRPFFLLGSVSAVLSMLIWLLLLSGVEVLPIAIDPISWHAHSFLFTYLWALIAGFLMTAVPNWTGRLPIVGWPLGGLVLLWLVSRLAMPFSGLLPYPLTIILDISFPIVFVAAIAREIIAGKNWRNLKMLVLIVVLIGANGIFDIESLYLGYGADGYGARLAVAMAILLISLIGGRVVPSFTRNWLAKVGSSQLPVQFNKEDKIIMLITVCVLLIWLFQPDSFVTGVLSLLAGFANLRRLYRWRGWLTVRDPLVAVLHVAFFFVPLGFLAVGLTNILHLEAGRAPVQHLWMAGGIGLMTMAIMTRASLGHAGRPLQIGWPVVCVYASLLASIFLRVLAGFFENASSILHPAAAFWMLGFALFVVLYWNILTKPRVSR